MPSTDVTSAPHCRAVLSQPGVLRVMYVWGTMPSAGKVSTPLCPVVDVAGASHCSPQRRGGTS
jgi:hypothetical protein